MPCTYLVHYENVWQRGGSPAVGFDPFEGEPRCRHHIATATLPKSASVEVSK